MFPDKLQTERLRLRRVRVREESLEELYERFRAGGSGGAVFEYVPDEPFDHLGDAVDHCADHERGWKSRESVHYFVEPIDSPTDSPAPDGLLSDGGAGEATALPDRSAAVETTGEPDGATPPLAGVASAWWLWERDTAKLGLLLAPDFWGRGYALEVNARLTEMAFDRLDLGAVQIGHSVGNEKSRSAVESYIDRFDGHREGVRRHGAADGSGPVDVVRYVVTRDSSV